MRLLPVAAPPLALPVLTGPAGVRVEGGGPLVEEDRGREPSGVHLTSVERAPRGRDLP